MFFRDWLAVEKELSEIVKCFIQDFIQPSKYGITAKST